jgi:spermidine synthase
MHTPSRRNDAIPPQDAGDDSAPAARGGDLVAPVESLAVQESSDPWDLYTLGVSDVIFQGHTRHQSVLIATSFNYGRILVLDGSIQSASCDERLYHEMLVQPALLWHGSPKNVLIIGGGEGATLRETLRHRTVERATMVDIDDELVELCTRHLPSWHQGAFSDPRSQLIIGDGREYVEQDGEAFDVVIIDVVDMLDDGPAQKLYTRQFYELVRRRLRPGGIVVVQALEFSFNRHQEHAALFRTLKSVFSEVYSYSATVPSFLCSWGFLIASDSFQHDRAVPAALDVTIARQVGTDNLAHIDGGFIRSCFAMTKRTRALLESAGPVLEDGVPFSQVTRPAAARRR